MYAYPAQARINRRLPKNVIYQNAKPSTAVKSLFVSQVREIVWQYKLSKETVNLAPKGGYTEIQVFDIMLKEPDLDRKVCSTIDNAIPYPIFFRLHFENRVKSIAAYKRPGLANDGKWVTGIYFEDNWKDTETQGLNLPVALDMRSLYEQMLAGYIDLARRPGETMLALLERVQLARKKQREVEFFKKKITREKQFHRKVDFNARIRLLEAELAALAQ